MTAATGSLAEGREVGTLLLQKLIPWTLRTFRDFSATPHTLTINENGINNMVTTDRASTAPNWSQDNSSTKHKTARDSLATDLQDTDWN